MMKYYSLFTVLAFVICSISNMTAQIDSGCIDPVACNFNPDALEDDGSCIYGQWYLPINFIDSDSEPAVFACTAPTGYVLAANQACVQSVVNADTFCVDVDWDDLCEEDYITCSSFGCTDELACNYNPDAIIDDGSCILSQWYLPIDFSTSENEPAIASCSAPPGYELALDQTCINDMAIANPFCVDVDWDLTCQNDYLACAADGCPDISACNYSPLAILNDDSCIYPQWYLPEDFFMSALEPAIFSCSPPPGYVLAESQTCIEQIVLIDSFCAEIDWDELCQLDYEACMNQQESGCTDSMACNFNPDAIVNDGSCVYPVLYPADFNDDLIVTAADITGLLGIFGNPCEEPQACGCKGDFNLDGDITAADLVGFLAEFGADYN